LTILVFAAVIIGKLPTAVMAFWLCDSAMPVTEYSSLYYTCMDM